MNFISCGIFRGGPDAGKPELLAGTRAGMGTGDVITTIKKCGSRIEAHQFERGTLPGVQAQ